MNRRKLKYVFVGEVASGKSALLKRLLEDKFSKGTQPTVAIDFKSMKQQGVGVHLWDTSGSPHFRQSAYAYFNQCDAVFIVFDASHPIAEISAMKWFHDILRRVDARCKLVLVANKIDRLASPWEPSREFQKMCEAPDVFLFQTSAKTGHGVNTMIDEVFTACMKTEGNEALRSQKTPLVQTVKRYLCCCNCF